MKTWRTVLRFVSRFRHRVSLPDEVAEALGISLSNFITVPELLASLAHPGCCPTRLYRFMSRDDAEMAFHFALRIERFSRHTLCSYYFKDGWLEFVLQFDAEQRLRRVYVHHKHLQGDHGLELLLSLQRASLTDSHPRSTQSVRG